MAESGRSNGAALAAYIAEVGERPLPAEVADRARLCLADWLGVAIGAGNEAAGRIVREVAVRLGQPGACDGTVRAPAAAAVRRARQRHARALPRFRRHLCRAP